jgi:hypothetical protein
MGMVHRLFNRLQEVMLPQAVALRRLRLKVGVLGMLQLAFCAGALAVQDMFLLSGVAEQRMGFMDRTVGYFQNSFWVCFSLRTLNLASNEGSDLSSVEEAARKQMRDSATAMLKVHSLNYVSPPSREVGAKYV